MAAVTTVQRASMSEIEALLRQGGVIAFPTDTVYGVGALAGHDAAVERIFKVKQRPRDKAIPILIGDVADLSKVAAEVPPVIERLIRAFWPGGLTVVLPVSPSFRSAAVVGGTVAVRLPDHDWLRGLLRAVGPMAATSANRSGGPSPVRAEEVQEQIGEGIDLIVDGGRTHGGTESSVVEVTQFGVRMLREGAVSRSDLERIVNSPVG